MEIDKEKFKKKYPKIAEELEHGSNKIKIGSGKIEGEPNKKDQNKGFRGYNPSVIDFIRRCNKVEEVESIISYLEKRGEISEEYNREIREQIKERGIRSLGSKKRENYYFRKNKKNEFSLI